MFARRILRFRAVNYRLLEKRNKYIVLLPEIPPDTPETNPLLRSNELPPFSLLTVDKCVNAIGKLVIEYESGIHDLDQRLYNEGFQRNIQNIILPLDKLAGQLDFAWGAFKILHTVHKDEDFAKSYLKLHSRIIKAKREKYFSHSLFKAFKELKGNEAQFTESIKRMIDKHLLESLLSGIDLSDGFYSQYKNAISKLDQYRVIYRKNFLETTAKFSHDLEMKDIADFPKKFLHYFAADKSNPSIGPWAVTLDRHVYKTFMEYCGNRLLRWNAWYAYNTRATSISGKEYNNSLSIEEIRYQRKELAKLLGFKTFADLSMKTKMAGSVETVMEMITTLQVKSKCKTLKEIEELQQFAQTNGFSDKLELWDIPYFQRLQKETLFNVDDDVVRQYFPFPVVLNGLFKLCHQLFNITIQEVKENIDVWREDVSYYQILDEEKKEIASFYLDPYYQGPEKNQTSVIEIGRNRSDVIGCKPLSYVVFNFPPSAFGRPSLLSFDDVRNLFQKFGHLLQHSLTTVPYAEVAGLTNLEWDVVNVCPLVMNSFLKHHSTICAISSHVDTGKSLPLDMHQELLRRESYMSGLQLTEELFLSALDLELYKRADFWLAVTKDVWQRHMPFSYPKDTAKTCSFPEIFCDQYPAAYFSNLWSKMIAADIFKSFEEAGLEDSQNMRHIGQRFRDTFLALGGGCSPGEIFRKFRGRDPSIDALLDDLNLKKPQESELD